MLKYTLLTLLIPYGLSINPAVIKESVASSNIENINTTVVGVLQNQLFPEGERQLADKEALQYRNAIMWGFKNQKKLVFQLE